MLNTENENPFRRIERQSNNNGSTTQPNPTDQRLAQKEKINEEIIKRIMSEKKTTSSSLRNQERKAVKTKTEKINKVLTHISTNNIT